MAITLISGNLNIWGDQGNFEADPSTWGFGSVPSFSITRYSLYTKGSNCCFLHYTGATTPAPTLDQIKGKFTYTAGKKYYIKAWVRTGIMVDPLFSNDASVVSIGYNGGDFSLVSQVTTTLADCLDTWVKVELQVVCTTSGNTPIYVKVEPFDGSTDINTDGFFFVDEFEVYEYVDDTPPACTLLINAGGSTIVDSTGSDGSITIATSGGTGPFEYSKDNGATWQSSNLFAGLAPGIYFCKVREVATPSCVDSYVFSVPASAYVFSFTSAVTDETVVGANDGTIVVTVTGTGGPFTFSKDAGITYQPSNLFTGLAPGVYTIVVKDSGGTIRAASVTVHAALPLFEKAWLSKNPIPFEVTAPAGYELLNNFRMYCEVRVEDVTGSSSFISKLKQELYPDSNGKCLFNLRQAMQGVLSLNAPGLNETSILRLTDRIKFFKTYVGTLQDENVTPGSLTASLPSLVLYGGLSAYAYASVDFLQTYIRDNKKFMTWAPPEKVVDLRQEDYLNYWVFDLSTTQLKIRIKAYYSDNTSASATLETVSGVKYGELYQIPAGPFNCGVMSIDPTRTLVKYELKLLDQTDAEISETRIFIINAIKEPLTRFVMIVNSLGAHEVHLLTGEASLENKVTKETIQKYLPPIYLPQDGQFESTEGTYRGKMNYSTGYLTGRYGAAWRAYLTDLLMSKKFYDVTNGFRYPMQVITDTISAFEDHQYEHYLRFEATDAYQNQGYTPLSDADTFDFSFDRFFR